MNFKFSTFNRLSVLSVPSNGAYVQFYAEIHCCGDSDTSSTTGYFDSTFFDGAPVLQQTFAYDPYGNLSKSGTFPFQPTYNPATNRYASIPGVTVSYDNDGNVLWDGQHAYAWDVYGKSIAVDSVNLTYDALGRMVEQNRSGAYTQIVYSPTGAKLALMSGQTLTKGLVGLPGGGQAVYNSSGLLYYGHADHLGSIKMGSTTGRAFSWSLAFAPFAEIYSNSGPIDPDFTGMRSDIGGGIYDFPAREYTYLGRWPAPDPSGLGSAHLSDPQSLNRYAYVRNNPLANVDPNGLDCGEGPDDACSDDGPPGSGDAGGGGGGGGGLDPTSGGDQGNAGGACGPNDPLCFGNGVPGGADPSNNPLLGSSSGPGPGDQFGSIAEGGSIAAAYAYWQTVPGYDYGGGGEWGGEIYQNPDGTYSFDAGRSGGSTGFGLVANGVNIDPSAIPDGTTLVGDYHSEGVNPDAPPSTFSTGDIQGINNLYATNPSYEAAFLATPNGGVQTYLPSLGLTVSICNGCLGPPPPR